MSDGISESYRYQEEESRKRRYFKSILAYLKSPDESNLSEAVEKGDDCDYHKETVRSMLESLKAGEKKEWAKLLTEVSRSDEFLFKEFKAVSPFKGKLFISVEYGCGFVHLMGETKKFFDAIITRKGMRTYDADKYAVFLPDMSNEADIFWLECGIGGVTGPRPPKE